MQARKLELRNRPFAAAREGNLDSVPIFVSMALSPTTLAIILGPPKDR